MMEIVYLAIIIGVVGVGFVFLKHLDNLEIRIKRLEEKLGIGEE